MKLDNHIVNRLITDKDFSVELITHQMNSDVAILGKDAVRIENYASMKYLLSNEENRTYYVTNSVIDKLGLLDTKKCMSVEGWKVFNSLPDFKKTFIMPKGNTCIRVVKENGVLYFCHIDFKLYPEEVQKVRGEGEVHWILLYVDLDRNAIAENFSNEDGKAIAPLLYSLLCFVELCDNETIVVQPKQKHGTQKTGKIINILPFPITVINNTWNIRRVMRGNIVVIGHAAMRWIGEGRIKPKIVFIEPYTKSGYTRRSGKEIEKEKNNG